MTRCAFPMVRRRTGRTTANAATRSTISTTMCAPRCSGPRVRSSNSARPPGCWTSPTSATGGPRSGRPPSDARMADADSGAWTCAPVEGDPLEVPFIDRTRLERMLDELYEHFGAASFTVQWQYDRRGLLDAAVRLLADLRLVRRMPGGVAI